MNTASAMSLAAQPCLACDQTQVRTFLDLGKTALANKFLSDDALSLTEPKYPLQVGFCENCGHVQLTDTVPPADMFTDYLYISSASNTLREHFRELSETLVARHRLQRQDLVVDIGCNDGTLLSSFKNLGVRTLGVDPSENLAPFMEKLGIDRFTAFFGAATARQIRDKYGPASLITTTNTFPHIPRLNDFLTGIATLLAPGGSFVIEAHYLGDLLEQGAFDTVYHEHVSYWALGPMVRLMERNGLEVVNAEHLPIHHGQLRATVQRKGEGKVQPAVTAMLAEEREKGMDRFETYLAFAKKTETIKQQVHETLRNLRASGKQVVGYGAPAKGSTLLEYLEVGPDLLPYIVDKSPLKQGLYTPGSHIPIVPPERLLTEQPDYVLLLAWNFRSEILEQQQEYRARGGHFILPLPEVQIV